MNRILSAALGATLFLPAMSAAAPVDTSVPVHRCRLFVRVADPVSGQLEALKLFREDGTVYSMQVQWASDRSHVLRLSGPREYASVRFEWPGGVGHEKEPLDWTRGTIAIRRFPAAPDSGPLRGEEWSRIVIDRDGSVRSYVHRGTRRALLPTFAVRLAGDLEPPADAFHFESAIDTLRAWGSGVSRLTVYETRVTRSKRAKSSLLTSPAGRTRIVGQYDIDMAAFTEAVARIRETTQSWEATLPGSWRQCERGSAGGNIVLTGTRPEAR